MLLEDYNPDFIYLGILCFAIGHLFGKLKFSKVLFVASAVYIYFLWNYFQEYLIPVLVYTGLLCFKENYLFILSDILLGINIFVKPTINTSTVTLNIYWLSLLFE
jgi:hypothetical protein